MKRFPCRDESVVKALETLFESRRIHKNYFARPTTTLSSFFEKSEMINFIILSALCWRWKIPLPPTFIFSLRFLAFRLRVLLFMSGIKTKWKAFISCMHRVALSLLEEHFSEFFRMHSRPCATVIRKQKRNGDLEMQPCWREIKMKTCKHSSWSIHAIKSRYKGGSMLESWCHSRRTSSPSHRILYWGHLSEWQTGCERWGIRARLCRLCLRMLKLRVEWNFYLQPFRPPGKKGLKRIFSYILMWSNFQTDTQNDTLQRLFLTFLTRDEDEQESNILRHLLLVQFNSR